MMEVQERPDNDLKWAIRIMRIAHHEVAQWSKDPDHKVGCVIVSPDMHQLTTGYNGFPMGIADTLKRLNDKAVKNDLMVHAELNAILNASKNLSGWTLYVTRPPCLECAKAIIQAGIDCVVHPPINPVSNWAVRQQKAKRLLMEAQVSIYNIRKECYK